MYVFQDYLLKNVSLLKGLEFLCLLARRHSKDVRWRRNNWELLDISNLTNDSVSMDQHLSMFTRKANAMMRSRMGNTQTELNQIFMSHICQ